MGDFAYRHPVRVGETRMSNRLREGPVARARLAAPAALSDDEIRELMLRYLFDRNRTATSRRGKSTGAAVTISVMRKELKAQHGLTVQQVHSNLTYLESMGWVEDQPQAKSFATGRGSVVPSVTNYYIITAAGIDRMGGPSVFTRNRFEGIKVEATGQNIITLGDGNQVNVRFKELGECLGELRREIKESDRLNDTQKLDLVVDVDTIQAQLARPTPDVTLVARIWEGINRAASVAGLVQAAAQVAHLIANLSGKS
jgi:hypothetical protein